MIDTEKELQAFMDGILDGLKDEDNQIKKLAL